MLRRLILSALLICAPFVNSSTQSAEPVLTLLPESTNTVAILNVEGLIQSQLGIENGWKEKHDQAYVDGALAIPPWVTQFLRASQYVPGAGGEDWALALVPLDGEDRLEKVAKLEGNEVQQIDEHPAVFSSRYNGYFVELKKSEYKTKSDLLALLAPAGRQETARWLDSSRSGIKVSPYLQEAVSNLKPQLILAMDTEHLFDPVQIRYRLNGSAAVEKNPSAKAALTLNLQSMSGIRFAVTATEKLNAEVRFDFGRSIGPEAKLMKELFVEFLNDAGHSLDEFTDASVAVEGKSVKLSTELTQESLRRVLSLIASPHPAHEAERKTPRAPNPELNTQPYDLAASKRFYNAVISSLRDLEKSYLNSRSTYARTAGWHDSYAKRIQRLPTAGVHPELLRFADSMAQDLEILADSLRGSQVEYNQLNSQIRYQKEYKYNPKTGFEWWWGPPRTAYGYVATPQNTDVIVHTNVDEVREAQQQAGAKGADDRKVIWSQMSAERDKVKNRMVEVFGEEFLD